MPTCSLEQSVRRQGLSCPLQLTRNKQLFSTSPARERQGLEGVLMDSQGPRGCPVRIFRESDLFEKVYFGEKSEFVFARSPGKLHITATVSVDAEDDWKGLRVT